MTAQRTSTNTDTAKDFGLITDTDLTQLDSGTEYTSQIFYQLTEIDTSVCGKVKQQFVVVKSILCLHQFHGKTVFFNLFQTDLVCIFFFLMVLLFDTVIFRCCHTNDCFQRLNHFIICNVLWWDNYGTVLDTTGSLHNDVAAALQFQVFRIKIIHFARLTESYSSYFYHLIFSLIVNASISMVRSKFTFARIRLSAVSIASKICCSPA